MEHRGWLNPAIAWFVMGLMHLCAVFGLAELSSAIPTAGAGYGFARNAMGRTAESATGLALVIEYVCAPTAIFTFIANYVLVFGILPEGTARSSSWRRLILFSWSFALLGWEGVEAHVRHQRYRRGGLLAFVMGMLSHFNLANLLGMPAAASLGASEALPFGLAGMRQQARLLRHDTRGGALFAVRSMAN